MNVQKPLAETAYKEQLEALAEYDKNNRRPEGWKLSSRAVRTFILGSEQPVYGVQINTAVYGINSMTAGVM